ncbi:MAG: CapA family protein [Butyrivibrio sp.]|jgi:poly-gamma-glutamate synthesis protein (capsule biosynthesis protein)|nr:CapA family protein [Butyrivibrio sp.]
MDNKVGGKKKKLNKKTVNRRKNRRSNDSVMRAISLFFTTLMVVVSLGILFLIVFGIVKESIFQHNDNDSVPQYTKSNPPGNMVQVSPLGSQAETEIESSGTVSDTDELVETDEYTYVIDVDSDDSITMGFAGDILFDPNYAIMNSIRKNGGISSVIDSNLMDMMNSVDVMMLNNEFSYSDRGTPTEGKTYTFRADPSSASMLNEMGVDIVSIANNHAYDYGETAFLDTMSTLKNYGIAYSGGGNNIDEASHPIYYIADNGIKVAIISATQIERLENPDTKGATESSAGVFRCLDDSLLLERVEEAKAQDAFVIVFIHWGTENQTDIDWWQEKQAAEISDAGADLIIGCHPHILQKVGYVNDTPVVYSLGNYLFNSKTLDTCMIYTTIYGDGTAELRFVPAIQSGCTLNMATGDEYLRIINYMNAISDTAVIDGNGIISSK